MPSTRSSGLFSPRDLGSRDNALNLLRLLLAFLVFYSHADILSGTGDGDKVAGTAAFYIKKGQGEPASKLADSGLGFFSHLYYNHHGDSAGSVKAVITYEDEFGNATTLEKEINLTVNPVPAPQQPNPEGASPPEQEEKGIVVEPWVYWVGGAVVVGIAALIVTISLLRRRSRREKTSDPDLLGNDPLVDLGR